MLGQNLSIYGATNGIPSIFNGLLLSNAASDPHHDRPCLSSYDVHILKLVSQRPSLNFTTNQLATDFCCMVETNPNQLPEPNVISKCFIRALGDEASRIASRGGAGIVLPDKA